MMAKANATLPTPVLKTDKMELDKLEKEFEIEREGEMSIQSNHMDKELEKLITIGSAPISLNHQVEVYSNDNELPKSDDDASLRNQNSNSNVDQENLNEVDKAQRAFENIKFEVIEEKDLSILNGKFQTETEDDNSKKEPALTAK